MLALVVIFRNYKSDYIKALDKKEFSLRFILGLAAACTDIFHKIPFLKKTNAYSKERQLLSSINVGISTDKSQYNYHLRIITYSICIIFICCFLGFAYSITISDKKEDSIANITRPSAGEGDQTISLITDNDIYSGSIDFTIKEEEYSFDEVMDIFSSHRTDFDRTVLGENISFLHIDSPLTLPSTFGDEGITVSWYISDTHILDYTGTLIAENISRDGSSLELIATFTLGDFSADICYQLKVYPPKLSAKDALTLWVNDYINSDSNSTDSIVELPKSINGYSISFFKEKTVYPSMDFCITIPHFFNFYHLSRETKT